jgi:hypothetical protein
MSPKQKRTFRSRTMCRMKNIFMWDVMLSVRRSDVATWQKSLTPSFFRLWDGRLRFHPEDYFHLGCNIVWLTWNLPTSGRPATSIFNFIDKATSFHSEDCCHMEICAVWLNRILPTLGSLILNSSGWYSCISLHWNVYKFLPNLEDTTPKKTAFFVDHLQKIRSHTWNLQYYIKSFGYGQTLRCHRQTF